MNKSDNTPLQGVKGDLLESGVRVPFSVQWKGTVKPSQVIDLSARNAAKGRVLHNINISGL